LLREAAEKLGIPVLVDDGTADVLLDCAGMLSWCLDN
jgi:hypothetical protein